MRFWVFLLFILNLLPGWRATAATPVEVAFLEIYSPILKLMGLDLKLEVDDESPDYFGGASLEPGVFIISMGENQKAKSGILAYTLCHEIGHLLGGAPKKTTSTWASTEAQSDFYASSVCLKELFKKNPGLVSKVKYPSAKSTDVCTQSFAVRIDQIICQSIADITLEFFTDIWNLIGFAGIAKPSLETQTPATFELDRIYPSLQCRLEIALSGATCATIPCKKAACF